jgi:succinate-acetate transporter protein/CBS domain-containing protein
MEAPMVVKDVMSSDVAAVPADASLANAIETLEQHGVGVLAVYNGDELVGSVTEHDIAAWLAAGDHDPTTAKVRDVVHREARFSREDQDVREVARMMKDQHLNGMVVIRGDQPVGSVSLADLATRVDSGERLGPLPGTQAERIPIAQDNGLPPARVFLQPIAAPSILGLFGFAGAAFVFGAFTAGWFGSAIAPLYFAPFVAIFGGLAVFLAGMWAYRARDGLGTAMYGTWGAFWLAYGLLYLLVATHSLVAAAIGPVLGWWFIPLAAITIVGAVAALGRNLVQSAMWLLLFVASALAVIGLLKGSSSWLTVSGYFFMATAIVAWYAASAILLEDSFRRVVLPLGQPSREANIPGRRITHILGLRTGEPGVRAG